MDAAEHRPSAIELAWTFEELSARAAFAGENPWKVRAYAEVARRLQEGSIDLSRPDRFTDLPGIGRNIARKLQDLLAGRPLSSLERLRREQPPGLLALLSLPGIGPKTARSLWEAGIGDLEDLRARIALGLPLPGLSARQREEVRTALALRQQGIPLAELLPFHRLVLDVLEPPVEAAGGFRRIDPVVRDPCWVAIDSPRNRARQKEMPPTLPSGYRLPADWLRLTAADRFGAALVWATGPPTFISDLAARCAAQGLRLQPDGLYQGSRLLPTPREQDVFAAAGVPFLPPHRRSLASLTAPPTPWQVRGDLHCHSRWSDGRDEIAAMVAKACSLGYQYLAITDHTAGLKVAHGLTAEDFAAQRAEIEGLRPSLPPGFQLLQGAEVNILADGELDAPDGLLAQLDVVIASVHTDLQQGVEEATARLIRAVCHPLVSILGHPSARKLGRRPPLPADWERVAQAAIDSGTVLEMSASPRRFDLDRETVAQLSRRSSLRVAVNTDAHATYELDYMPLGLAQAEVAGLEPRQILNLQPLDAISARLGRSS